MPRPVSGPAVWRSFSVSRNPGIEFSSGTPQRAKKAREAASDPARDAVWETVAACAAALRPALIATTGLPAA